MKVAIITLCTAALLSGCAMTPMQKKVAGVVVGVLVVGAIAAHEHDSGKPLVPSVATPSVDCSSTPEFCR